MPGSLRSFKVTTRIMALTGLLVSLMVAALSYLLYELDIIGQRSEQQRQQVVTQNGWIIQQADLIANQSENQRLQRQAQLVQKHYSEMLFWYFDGSITQYYESLNKAAQQADSLDNLMSELMIDPQAAAMVQPMLVNLQQYRELMNQAINYYQQGRDNLAAAEIGDAHQVVQYMNQQLLELTELFQKRLQQANREVELALDQTLAGSEAVERSSQASSQQIDWIRQSALALLLISVPLSMLIAVPVIRSITIPLHHLRQQLLEIDDKSDLTQPLTLAGRDEIREMSEATQNLLHKLRGTLHEVGEMADRLKSTADSSYQVSLQTHQQSTEQQHQSESIASAATELGATAEDIARTTETGLDLVKTVGSAANRGLDDVQATAESIEQLAEQFQHVERTVLELADQGTSIVTVLEVINDIAEQTNLLALNAAIEAARAGDQGRGFAVVADEVRTLAQRTRNSTNEIQRMVDTLQQRSEQAIRSLDTNRDQVDLGVQLSKQAAQSLARIQQQMAELTQMNHSIALITGEQRQALGSVDENVQQVRQLACNVELHAADSRAANEELNAMAQQLQNQLLAFKH